MDLGARWLTTRPSRIPILPNDQPWNTLAYHPEEITELYLGSEMEAADLEDIVRKARGVNPDIKIFRARRNGDGSLRFDSFEK